MTLQLADMVAEKLRPDGIVTNVAIAFSWMGSDGLEHAAVARDGSPIAILGLLHMALEVYNDAVIHADPEEEL